MLLFSQMNSAENSNQIRSFANMISLADLKSNSSKKFIIKEINEPENEMLISKVKMRHNYVPVEQIGGSRH